MSARLALIAALACCQYDVSRDLGARCERDSQCNGECMLPSAMWPGGFCTLGCTSSSQCPGHGSDDAAGLGAPSACFAELGGVCAFVCGSAADCAFLGSDYTCATVGEAAACLGS